MRKLLRNLAVFCISAAVALPAFPAKGQMITGPETCVGGPADPASFALAKGIVDVIIPPEQGDAMMQQMMSSMMDQMRQGLIGKVSDPGLQAIINRQLQAMPERFRPLIGKHLPSIGLAMACGYVREFSLEELRNVNAFAASPSGRHYLSRSATMISDPTVAQANQAYFTDAKAYLAAFQAETSAEITKYLGRGKKRK